jgi:cyclic pyranopterin phosphate synthase
VARRYHTENGQEFGFINSVTEPFCGSCTRARLSANGSLYTCLFASEGHDVKSLIRMGASEKDVQNAVRSIWNRRDDTYSLERAQSKDTKPKVEMSFIGG